RHVAPCWWRLADAARVAGWDTGGWADCGRGLCAHWLQPAAAGRWRPPARLTRWLHLHTENAALPAGDDPEADDSLVAQPVVELQDAARDQRQRAGGLEDTQHAPVLRVDNQGPIPDRPFARPDLVTGQRVGHGHLQGWRSGGRAFRLPVPPYRRQGEQTSQMCRHAAVAVVAAWRARTLLGGPPVCKVAAG